MKTEKQIKLLTEQYTKECYEAYEKLDTISVTRLELKHIIDVFFQGAFTLDFTPFLPAAHVCIDYGEVGYDYIYTCEPGETEEGFILDTTILLNGQYYCSEYIKIDNPRANALDSISVASRGYVDVKYEIMHKQGYKQEEMDEYINKKSEENTTLIHPLLLFTFAAANAVSENRETYTPVSIADNSTVKPEGKSKAENQGETDKHGRRTVKLGGFLITTGDAKLQKAITGRKNRRLTGSWSVRGHYRHYRDGKVVYVRPYEKGTGRKQTKTYILGDVGNAENM